MKISIDRNSKVPIYWQIEEQIKSKIVNEELLAKMKLPSERDLAKSLMVHRNTVTKAYNELKSEGLIEAKQGIGYIVSSGPDNENNNRHGSNRVNWHNAIKNYYLDYESTFDDIFMSNQKKGVISFGGGMASKEIFSETKTAEMFKDILTNEDGSSQYFTPYKGDKSLRRELVSFLSTKGIESSYRNIQVMPEMNQALDFIVTILINEGDMVFVEEPVSPDVYRTFKLAGANIFTLEMDKDGIITKGLEGLIKLKKPKLIFISSGYNDPSGVITSLERRKELLAIANKYRIPIIEEDENTDLYYDGYEMPTLKSMDEYDNVIYIYTFQFTFIPGLAMAFVVANNKVIDSLSNLVSTRLMSLDWIKQRLLTRYLSDGTIIESMDEIRELYLGKRNLMGNHLKPLLDLGYEFDIPKGGVYYWCKLPHGVTSKNIYLEAKKNGITLIPGEIFYPNGKKGRDRIRLNYSYESCEKINEGMCKLVDLLEKEKLAHEKSN